PTPTISVDVVKTLQNSQEALTDMKVHLETQLNKLTKLEKSQQREAIQTALEQPDTQLTTLLNELDLAEQRVLYLGRDVTESNAQMINAKAGVRDLNEKPDRRVEGILLGLATRLEATDARLTRLSQRLDNARTTDVAMAQSSRPYYDAKQKLAEMLQFRQ